MKNEIILNKIKKLRIDCPDCEDMYETQYTCATCWNEGGNGKINVYEYLTGNTTGSEPTHPDIYTWLKEQKRQTTRTENGEYVLYYELDMPKILEAYFKWRTSK